MNIKLGFQSRKHTRVTRFNNVNIKGDLHYCESHDFVFDTEVEEQKLYNGLPNYYTDKRYASGNHNYFKETYLHFSRHRWGSKYAISLKSAFRLVETTRNIPVGTIVKFMQDWTIRGIDNSYRYIVKKENTFDPDYKVSLPSYFANFKHDGKSANLVNALREEGFLVQVFNSNPGFLIGEEDGEIAVAYGHNLKIGISSYKNTFRGYKDGCESILYDFYGEFDKWSSCYEISKDLKIKKIISLLKNAKKDEDNI